MVRRLPVCLLVHRAARIGWLRGRWRWGRSRSASRRSPTRPGRRGTTSSASSSCSPPSRSRSMPGRGRGAAEEDRRPAPGCRCGLPLGALVVVGLAAGLAAGTKLNFLLPAAVLVLGLVAVAARGRRLEALAAGGLAALAGGGYWYLRNLAHTGNPLPWFDGIGPISLPAPEQALGGREAHSVLGYLTDGTVWSEWLLPGLQHGLGNLWLLLLLASVAGLTLALLSGWRDRVPAVAGLAGLAAAAAWLVAPTSASGPEGMPRGFESGLRYLAPALVLGLALLPTAPILRDRLRHWGKRRLAGAPGARTRPSLVACLLAAALVIAAGYVVQRHYLRDRYANPTFATPGLNAAFQLGDAALRGADRDHQHAPVPALRHRPLQPGRVRRRRAAPRRLRRALQLPRLAPPPRPGRLRLRRRQPRPGRTGQAALPRHGPLDRRPRRHRDPAQAPHRRLQAHRPPDPSTCPAEASKLTSRRGSPAQAEDLLSSIGGWALAALARVALWRGGRERTQFGPPAGPLAAVTGPARRVAILPTRPWTTSATSRSSPTSTTASRPWPTASSRSPGRSTRRKCRRRCSTRWTSSASAGSRSRRRRSGSSTRPPTARPFTCT